MGKASEALRAVNWLDKFIHFSVILVTISVGALLGFHELAGRWEDLNKGIGDLQESVEDIAETCNATQCHMRAQATRMTALDNLAEYVVNDAADIHEVALKLGIPPEELRHGNPHIKDFSALAHGTVIVYDPALEGRWQH